MFCDQLQKLEGGDWGGSTVCVTVGYSGTLFTPWSNITSPESVFLFLSVWFMFISFCNYMSCLNVMFTLSKEALIFLAVAGTNRPNIDVLKIKNLVIYYMYFPRKEKGKEKHYRYHKARCYSILLWESILSSTHCKEPTPKIQNKYSHSQKMNCAATVNFHIHVSERFIHSRDRSAYSGGAGNM